MTAARRRTVATSCCVGVAVLVPLIGIIGHLDQNVVVKVTDAVRPHPNWVTFWRTVTDIGQPLTWKIVVTAMALVLVARRRSQRAIEMALTIWAASLLTSVLKVVTHRPRPVIHPAIAHAAGWSFPSGHTLTAVVGAGLLLTSFSTGTRPRLRWTVAVLLATSVLLVGASRVALGVHFPSDVIAGGVLGYLWLIWLPTLLSSTFKTVRGLAVRVDRL